MLIQEEVIKHVIKNEPYKGWICNYVGLGTVIFEKFGYEPIKAYRAKGDNWTLDCWVEIKGQIDAMEDLTKLGLYEKYKYWEVCKDKKETQGVLCAGSVWGQEWHSINKVLRPMSKEELKQLILDDINLHETCCFEKVDRRKVAGAIAEIQKILKKYK